MRTRERHWEGGGGLIFKRGRKETQRERIYPAEALQKRNLLAKTPTPSKPIPLTSWLAIKNACDSRWHSSHFQTKSWQQRRTFFKHHRKLTWRGGPIHLSLLPKKGKHRSCLNTFSAPIATKPQPQKPYPIRKERQLRWRLSHLSHFFSSSSKMGNTEVHLQFSRNHPYDKVKLRSCDPPS